MTAPTSPEDKQLSELSARYRAALDQYTRELRKTTQLLLVLEESPEGMQRFLGQQEREAAAFDRFRNLRRQYLKALQRREGNTSGIPPSE
jgi:hypothetical protein